ncbi:32 kDa beta-galactoside-binding lectin-like [Physella acuta]|uniref:32 kDa beta-galactoside-binding lectin-like n=1 Tax=Physella acuta TaxID=109671 RepID=UPI0027DE73D6|nr:32 kDa beta-galactoside-binding lectin-like [Physella acuta]
MMELVIEVLLANLVRVFCVGATYFETRDNVTFQQRSKPGVIGTHRYKMPYTGEILYPIHNGKEIIIEGAVPIKATRFAFELCPSRDCMYESELHVNVRFQTHNIVINNKRFGVWGRECTSILRLVRGRDMVIRIVIDPDKYGVYFNKTLYVAYKGKTRLDKLKYIRVYRDIIVHWILYSLLTPPQMISFTRSHWHKFIFYAAPVHSTKR